MKAEVFAVGFFLVFTGAWFTYAKHTGGLNIKGMSNKEQRIVINSDNFHEEMAWTGKISFTEDETAIAGIAPGGYISYTKNELEMEAKSDSAAQLHYTVKENGRVLPLDSNAHKIITEAISEMIAWGVDAKGRLERVYKKGGYAAVLDAMDKLKGDGAKKLYAEKIFSIDSVAPAALIALSKKLAAPGINSYDKEQVLKMYKASQLKDTTAYYAYLQAVESLDNSHSKAIIVNKMLLMPLATETFPALFRVINSIDNDYEKATIFSSIIEKRQMDSTRADLLLNAIDQLDADHDKENLLTLWISKGTIPADRLDKVLAMTGKFGADVIKENMYRKLAAENIHSEEQWVSLITAIAHMTGNFQKAGLLTEIALKMPKTEMVKTAYLAAARTITTDMEYGRAVRAVD